MQATTLVTSSTTTGCSRPLTTTQAFSSSMPSPLCLHRLPSTPCQLASTSQGSGWSQPPRVLPHQRHSRSRRHHRCSTCSVASSSGIQMEDSTASSSRASILHGLEAHHTAEDTHQVTAAGLQQIIREKSRPDAAGKDGLGVHSRAAGGGPEGTVGSLLAGTAAASPQASSSANGTLPVEPKYKTVMLKVSGEALMGPHGFGVDPQVLMSVAEEVAAATRAGVKIAIVVGGGNFFRGAQSLEGLERATGDYVGMLATVMNALCLQSALEKVGVETRVQTAIEMREVAEPYIRRRAISHLNAGRVVIFGAGTGNPFFTTDTAAALRAAEMNAEVFLKATKVDGVYDSDPFKNPNARRYDQLSYRQVCFDSLNVMDETAITLCKENNIPVIVFNIMEKGNICKAALGLPVGTVVDNTTPFHTEVGM